MEYYVYMLRCHGDLLYTGITADIKKRMREHVLALPAGAKFTRAHKPEQIVGLWRTEDKSTALKLEYRIKSLKRCDKLRLLEMPTLIFELFGDDIIPVDIPDLAYLINKLDKS